jgi:hypothetical protein
MEQQVPEATRSNSPQPEPLVKSDWPIAGLLALSVALWALGDRQQAGRNAELYLDGASGVAWYLVGLMLIAWVASRSSAPKVPYRQSLFLLSACAPLIVVLLWGASLVTEFEHLDTRVVILLCLIGAVVLTWGLRRVTGRCQWLAVWLSLMAAIGFGWASDALYVRPSIWYSEEAQTASADPSGSQDSEQLLFEQPDRVDRAVDQIAPREPGHPNAYFVGFAGYGGQKVFAEEIELASRVIGTKYGSMDRTVRLVNDQRDVSELPLATTSSLRRTLLEIGEQMDRSEDILFLVLSSHGSQGAQISVQNGGLPLRQLTVAELVDAIREAGIQWKVVVISACFAGSFVDALKDDHSIILTAAAADRTSFGCDDKRNLTYFGEAFFRDALPGAKSLREAFTRARVDINAKELAEGVTPSDPQAFFGAAMETHIVLLANGRGPDRG